MGKGNGDHPPLKFMNDQAFCQACIMVFMVGSITLSCFSIGMDDGGSFPYPYFFTGFVLGPILLVNLVSRFIVVRTIRKTELTRNNIIDVLKKTSCGNIVWPWSCRIGMIWCIPGSILTGLGGVNCAIEDRANGNSSVKNKCYYDIEGEHGEMYRGLAIGLVVMHVFSFVYLLFSNCPVEGVLDQIKEDPSPRRQTAVTPAAHRPAVQASTAQVPDANTAVSTISQTVNLNVASPPPAYSDVTNQAGACGCQRNIEMEVMKIQLDERTMEIERRERELSERERQLRDTNEIPPPPSYNQLMAMSN